MRIYIAITDVMTWGKSTNEPEAIARALSHTSKTPGKILLHELSYEGAIDGLRVEDVLKDTGINPMGNVYYPSFDGVSTGFRELPAITGDAAAAISRRWNSYQVEVYNAVPD